MRDTSHGRLGFKRLLAFSLPETALAMMLAPLGSFLPAFYAKHTAISLAAVGAVLTLTRLIDAATDQIIGYLSDITNSRFGRRRPWIAAGTVVSAISAYFLFTPPATAGFVYFFTATFFVYLGWTMVATPYYAWGSELTRDYNERTRVFSYIALAGPVGFLIVLGVPLLPIFETSDMTPEAVAMMGVIIVVALPLLNSIALISTPQGASAPSAAPSLMDLLRAIKRNKPFWRFIAAISISGTGLGLMSATIVLYMDSYLGIGDKIPQIFIPNMIAMLLAVYAWTQITIRIGKHQALAWSFAFNALTVPFVLLVEPGESAFPHFLLWMIAIGIAGSASVVVPRSLLGDIVDYDELKSGANRAGNYYAAFTLAQKSYAAVGSGAAFLLLAAFDFDSKAASQLPSAIVGLKIALVAIPIITSLASMLLMRGFPINSRRHRTIRKRLEQRVARTIHPESP